MICQSCIHSRDFLCSWNQAHGLRRETGLRLVGAAKQLDLLLNGRLDGFHTGSQQLAGVKALAFQILAGLDVLTGGGGEGQLALGVHVHLGHD